ncbi:Atpase Family Aaa Domain-Containing Protein 5 [Manis pentadactyla]|nr:Atpase Family Aaa Domain-Containing Protein 5 [Manis pentadactyla]
MKLKLEIYCDGFLRDLGAWRDSAVVLALQVCSLGDCLATGEHNPSQEQGLPQKKDVLIIDFNPMALDFPSKHLKRFGTAVYVQLFKD